MDSTPQKSFDLLIAGLEKSDKVVLAKVATQDAINQLESLSMHPEWKNSGLYLDSKQWKLNNSPTVWPILKRWATMIKNQPATWLPDDASGEKVYPVFRTDDSLSLIFHRQRDGTWLLESVVMTIAQ